MECEFCGYDPEAAHAIEDMTPEDKRAAKFFFPGMPEEEAWKHFLFHREGVYSDQFPDENAKTLEHAPKQISHPTPVYGDYPGEWYGTLWWKGREEGTPDPTLRTAAIVKVKDPWYKRLWRYLAL